ncbi:MAG: DUF4366 domain-containing protein [Lachnospirales bacterium]
MRKTKFLIAFAFSIFLLNSSPVTTYAKVDETQEIDLSNITEVPVVTEKPTEETEKTQEKVNINGNVPLTPDGNLTLVDDVTTSDETEKQFITAVSKNGNYFYLVIDRSDNKDNVYLLNLVDEAELTALIEEEDTTANEITEPVPIKIIPDTSLETETTDTTENEEVSTETEKPKKNALPAIMTLLLLVGGGVFYYLKFVKGGSINKGDTDVSEFDDDYDDMEDEEDIEYEVPDDLSDDDMDKLEDYDNDSL